MKKITNEEAIKRLSTNNSNVIILDRYYSSEEKSEFQCLICNCIWKANARGVINGNNGCPGCGKKKAKETIKYNITTDDFIKKIKKSFSKKINVIGEYINHKSDIKVECNICGRVWISKPKYLLAQYGCKKCGHDKKGKKHRKTHGTFVKEIDIIYSGKISILGKYITGDDKIEVKCNMCGNVWMPVSRGLLRRGCPKCNFSKGELLISNILKDLKLNFKEQYIFNGLKTENGGVPVFDFVIFNNLHEIKYVIEYDGIQHFKPIEKWGGIVKFERRQKIDKFKNKYCFDNNIKIIRIPYTEFKKINNKYIKNLLFLKNI